MHQNINKAATGEDDPKFPPVIAAKYLGLSPFTLGYWRKTCPNRLPFIKMGKAGTPGVRVFYRKSVLDEFMRQAECGKVAA